MDSSETKANLMLAAKVRAVNAANNKANELYPLLKESLFPFLGKQVLKKDGTILEKVKKALPILPKNTNSMMIHQNCTRYSLVWKVKTCTFGDCCANHETTVYVGVLSDGILTNFENWVEMKTNYTVEEIENYRAKYEELKSALNHISGKLYPFGERDI